MAVNVEKPDPYNPPPPVNHGNKHERSHSSHNRTTLPQTYTHLDLAGTSYSFMYREQLFVLREISAGIAKLVALATVPVEVPPTEDPPADPPTAPAPAD